MEPDGVVEACVETLDAMTELWMAGAFNLSAIREHHAGAELVHELGLIATESQVWLHAGSVPMGNADHAGKAYNTSLLFSPAGKLVATYRKRHLFGFADGERTGQSRARLSGTGLSGVVS